MIKEICTPKQTDIEHISAKLGAEDGTPVNMTGYVVDKIIYKDGRIEYREGYNLVVNSFLPLIMSLLKNEVGYSGMQYWAVGSGESSWDTSTPNPLANATTLTAELGRKAIPNNAISYLDANLAVTNTPTNKLQITITFGENECNGVWREFGIFGGNATSTADSGILINKKHHAILTKTSDMTVERTIQFTLNLN